MEDSKTARALEMINRHPGVRTPDLAEALDTNSVSALLQPYVRRGDVVTRRIQAPNGGWVTAYFPKDHPLPDRDISRPTQIRRAVRSAAPASGLVAALYTNGDMVIEVGPKSVRLTAEQTRDLITYLDRINVDQVFASIPAAAQPV